MGEKDCGIKKGITLCIKLGLEKNILEIMVKFFWKKIILNSV